MKDGRVVRTLKDQRREEAAKRRSAIPKAARERAAADLAEWIHTCPFRLEYDVTVAAYVPVGDEPGSTAMLDALLDRGVTVLLPVVPAGEPAPLDWARYTGPGSLSPGRWGPTRTHHRPPRCRRDPRGVGDPDPPALSVDKTGVRLGRGAGYYDRTLVGGCPQNSSRWSTTRSSSTPCRPAITMWPWAGR